MKLLHKSLKSALMASTVILPGLAFAQETQGQETPTINTQIPDEIVVTGRYIPDEKRSTSEISSVVLESDITAAGDSDVAVSLTRLPGISTDSSGKYVVVRGLNERYTSTLLNGTQLPSPDPLKTAVPLDIFPTSMIKSVLVQKTYSAQYPGAFGGSVIDIRTKVTPDERFFEIGLDVGYNTESTGKDGLGYFGSDTDWLGFDDGKRDLPAILQTNPTMSGFTDAEIEAAGESFPNVWSIDTDTNPVDIDFKVSLGDSFEVGDGSLGVILALDYGSSFRNRFGEQYVYSGSETTDSGLDFERRFGPAPCEEAGQPVEDCGYRTTTWDIDLNAFGSLGWQINGDNAITFTTLLLRSSQQQVEIKQGSTNSRDLANFTRLDWKERQVWSNSLFGEHAVDLLGEEPTQIDWFASFIEAKRDVPLRRTYEYFFDDVDQLFRMSARTDGNQTAFGAMKDKSKDFGVNIVQPTYLGDMSVDFKFGGSYNKKDRESDFKRYSYDLSAVRNRELREYVPEIIFGPVNVDPAGIVLREFIDASDRFDASFKNKQAYVQADAQVTDQLRLSTGMRYEDSVQVVTSVDRTTDEGIRIQQNLKKWLPSATATWEFVENMQVRLAFSETLNRPDSRELSPARFVREDGRTEEGNPNLKPATIRNFDARFEYYFGENESITIGAFYKEISNPIEYTIKPIGDGELDSIANAETAKLKGIEAEIQKSLWSLDEREFFLKANGSYIDSEVTRTAENFDQITNLVGQMQGQSKWLANVQFGFENMEVGERFNIVFNYIGERIYRLGSIGRPDLIEKPPVTLNLIYGREIEIGGSIIALSFKAKNLLGESAERTQGGLIAESYDVGRSFSLGLKYKF